VYLIDDQLVKKFRFFNGNQRFLMLFIELITILYPESVGSRLLFLPDIYMHSYLILLYFFVFDSTW
jgi:hypothetical protein